MVALRYFTALLSFCAAVLWRIALMTHEPGGRGVQCLVRADGETHNALLAGKFPAATC